LPSSVSEVAPTFIFAHLVPLGSPKSTYSCPLFHPIDKNPISFVNSLRTVDIWVLLDHCYSVNGGSSVVVSRYDWYADFPLEPFCPSVPCNDCSHYY